MQLHGAWQVTVGGVVAVVVTSTRCTGVGAVVVTATERLAIGAAASTLTEMHARQRIRIIPGTRTEHRDNSQRRGFIIAPDTVNGKDGSDNRDSFLITKKRNYRNF
jgi:hypothetical protein